MRPKSKSHPINWLEYAGLESFQGWASYGYEQIERLTEFGSEAMNPGSLYRTLGSCRTRE